MSATAVTLRTWGIATARTLDDWAALGRSFLSSDLKCSPVAGTSADGTARASDSVRVATWLPSGPAGTCPGASTYCHNPDGTLVCYSDRLERGRPALGRIVAERLRVWQSLTQGEKTTLCAAIIQQTVRMQTEPGPLSTHAGHPVAAPILRIGAGGDLDTAGTGQAWADALHWAADQYPTFRAWIYSRSYGLDGVDDPLQPLAAGIERGRLPNLTAYLSTDPSMIERTRQALYGRRQYGHLPVAVLADDRAQALALLDDLGRNPARRLVCPTDRDAHPWPLAMRRPEEPYARGACARCTACTTPAGSRDWCPDIIFIRR